MRGVQERAEGILEGVLEGKESDSGEHIVDAEALETMERLSLSLRMREKVRGD
jgi:hypothetical protein